MLLFHTKNVKNIAKPKIKSSLQVQKYICRANECKKGIRAFCPASCSAGFTVEAAFVLPIVLFAFCAFLYFMVIFNLQVILQEELTESARDVARYAFTYEEILSMSPAEEKELKDNLEPELTDMLYHGFSSAYALEHIKEGIGREWLDNSCIKGGADGLFLISDSLLDNNQMVDMVLRYRVEIPYLPGDFFELLCVQRVRIRAFTGFMPIAEEEESTEELVYITETGAVYHTNKYCTHLNLSIRAVESQTLATLRNNNGGKYYACELCNGVPEASGIVYLTVHGDRYHGRADCQGLKRTWMAIPLSQVGERRQCTRCQQQK